MHCIALHSWSYYALVDSLVGFDAYYAMLWHGWSCELSAGQLLEAAVSTLSSEDVGESGLLFLHEDKEANDISWTTL